MGIIERMLLVEDNSNLREDLKNIIALDNPSKVIDTAQNEYKALRLIEYREYEVIVTDIKLDEAGGTETGGLKVLEAALKKNRKTKVIVVTAYGKKEIPRDNKPTSERIPIEEEVIKLGAFKCIQRPNPNRNYLEEVRRYVNLALIAYRI